MTDVIFTTCDLVWLVGPVFEFEELVDIREVFFSFNSDEVRLAETGLDVSGKAFSFGTGKLLG